MKTDCKLMDCMYWSKTACKLDEFETDEYGGCKNFVIKIEMSIQKRATIVSDDNDNL